MIGIEDLNVGDLLIRLDRSGPACLRLDWLGPCDKANPVELIGPFFEKVLAEAREGGRGIDMHFEALAYLNSSCIASLVRFIRSSREARVALRIYYAADLKWQSVTFDLLERALTPPGGRPPGPDVEFLPARS